MNEYDCAPKPSSQDLPPYQSQISEQLAQLQTVTLSTEKSLDVLTSRLIPILREPEPELEACKTEIDSHCVQLAYEIRSIRLRVANINELITNVLDRIEL